VSTLLVLLKERDNRFHMIVKLPGLGIGRGVDFLQQHEDISEHADLNGEV
jgi:hypothetical protein